MRPAFLAGSAGALLVLISQFLNLYGTHIQSRSHPVATGAVGSVHDYGLVPLALVAVLLAYGVWRAGSRPAMLGIGLLGIVTLVIAFAHDLSFSRRQGLWSVGGHYVLAVNRPEVGFYVESLGGLVLLLACVGGFALAGRPQVGHGPDLRRRFREGDPV